MTTKSCGSVGAVDTARKEIWKKNRRQNKHIADTRQEDYLLWPGPREVNVSLIPTLFSRPWPMPSDIFHFVRAITARSVLKSRGWPWSEIKVKYKEDYFGFENQSLQTSLFASGGITPEMDGRLPNKAHNFLRNCFRSGNEISRLIVRKQRIAKSHSNQTTIALQRL